MRGPKVIQKNKPCRRRLFNHVDTTYPASGVRRAISSDPALVSEGFVGRALPHLCVTVRAGPFVRDLGRS